MHLAVFTFIARSSLIFLQYKDIGKNSKLTRPIHDTISIFGDGYSCSMKARLSEIKKVGDPSYSIIDPFSPFP